jgi:CHAD domain-containing protein
MHRVRGGEVEKGEFLKDYEEARESLSQRLDRFAKDPDEEAVHVARTAIRRVEALADVLPGGVRKSREMRELLRRLRKVMKRSAKVRDIDVIRGKVSRSQSPARAPLLAKIDKERRKLSRDSVEAVDSARELRLPKVGSRMVTRRGLQRRFERVVGRLSADVDELLPKVTADPARLEELHKLRIGCRKLRYTLELTLGEDSPDVVRLTRWQDALGEIHDWDVATSYVRQAGISASEDLLREWARERDREFRDFQIRAQPQAGPRGKA